MKRIFQNGELANWLTAEIQNFRIKLEIAKEYFGNNSMIEQEYWGSCFFFYWGLWWWSKSMATCALFLCACCVAANLKKSKLGWVKDLFPVTQIKGLPVSTCTSLLIFVSCFSRICCSLGHTTFPCFLCRFFWIYSSLLRFCDVLSHLPFNCCWLVHLYLCWSHWFLWLFFFSLIFLTLIVCITFSVISPICLAMIQTIRWEIAKGTNLANI